MQTSAPIARLDKLTVKYRPSQIQNGLVQHINALAAEGGKDEFAVVELDPEHCATCVRDVDRPDLWMYEQSVALLRRAVLIESWTIAGKIERPIQVVLVH